MEKERISVFQLVVLLYVCRSFNLLTATLHDVGAGYGAVQLAAYPLAAVFQLALMLPVWLLTRETGKGLGESAKEAAGRWGLLFSLLGAGYLLTTTALTLSSMGNFLVNTAFPGAKAEFFLVTLTLAAGYGAALGIEGLSRAALLLCVAFSLGLFLILLGVADRVGSLENGKDADIAIFSGNPMESFTETLYTILEGEVIYARNEKQKVRKKC